MFDTLEQIDLPYSESSGNVLYFFSLFLLCASFLTFMFCFVITVIESEAYRRKMVEQNETFTTNLQHAKFVRFPLPDRNLVFHPGSLAKNPDFFDIPQDQIHHDEKR